MSNWLVTPPTSPSRLHCVTGHYFNVPHYSIKWQMEIKAYLVTCITKGNCHGCVCETEKKFTIPWHAVTCASE